VSQTDPAPADSHQEISQAAPQEQYKQSMNAFGKFVERISPWLFEVGIWIFGGLIAFYLLVMAALLTIGPVDPAIMVATAAFALALPLDVAGLFLLRLVQDLKRVGFEEEVVQVFQDVGFTVGAQMASPKALESLRKRRTGIVLGSSLGILTLSVLLTLTGMTAALWHMAWWIGVAFFAMVMISLAIVIVAIVTIQPPDSEEEQELKRRYREEMTRQAKAQDKKNEERA
jgi:Organic Anion Transporter Polypeptide (OATP) family